MKKILSVIFCVFLMQTTCFAYDLDEIIEKTAETVIKNTENPTVSSIGGEWAVIGIVRSEIEADEFLETYKNNLKNYLEEKNGILSERKYTEYSRVILALTALGENPYDFYEFDLINPINNYENVVLQGINGAIWAILALDSNNYEENTEIRQMYIDYILSQQCLDGGFALSGDVADIDITGMVLQALSNYQNNEKVSKAIENALNCVSNMQNNDGSFENLEAIVQILVGISALDINIDDERFVKNGNTLIDALLSFYIENDGFLHSKTDENISFMATEQALYGLIAVKMQKNEENKFYDMTDIFEIKRHNGIKQTEILYSDITFSDINKDDFEIINLASRGIINGKGNDIFDPFSNMTRAEFATIIVRALGLEESFSDRFSDVLHTDWFAGYVGTAEKMGIINGVSEEDFNPNGIITQQEAMVMIARSAKLCGIDTKISNFENEIIDENIADWAVDSVNFCYFNNIQKVITPKDYTNRKEISVMVYNLLELANLLN